MKGGCDSVSWPLGKILGEDDARFRCNEFGGESLFCLGEDSGAAGISEAVLRPASAGHPLIQLSPRPPLPCRPEYQDQAASEKKDEHCGGVGESRQPKMPGDSHLP